MTEQIFIPELLINNKKEVKTVDIEGVATEVEIPAKKGFNIQTKDELGTYVKTYFTEDLEATVLADKYEIKSKYNSAEFFFSNEFKFTPGEDTVRVYCPTNKTVLYEGPYKGVREGLSNGRLGTDGKPEKFYDIFTVLYLQFKGKIFRLKWKLNKGNNWFAYSDVLSKRTFLEDKTKFVLSQVKVGANVFWGCTAELGGKNTDDEKNSALEATNKLIKYFEDSHPRQAKKQQKDEPDFDEPRIDDIPF